MAKKIQFRPEGFHTVNPYLVVNGAAQLLDFLTKAFGAEQVGETPGASFTARQAGTVRALSAIYRHHGACSRGSVTDSQVGYQTTPAAAAAATPAILRFGTPEHRVFCLRRIWKTAPFGLVLSERRFRR